MRSTLACGQGKNAAVSAASNSCLLHFTLTRFGVLRHIYRETAVKFAPDIQGPYSQVFISTVCWCVSSDCGCAKQPEQGDEGANTCLQSRLWFVPFQFHSISLTGCPLAASQPPRWYDLLTGSAEYGGGLEGKIEEVPRDLPKCTRLELSPPPFFLPMFRKHHGPSRRGLLRALSTI